MSILQDYQVKFSIKKIFNKDFKRIYTVNDVLSSYISDHNNIMQVNLLLNEINDVIDGIKTIGGWDTQSMYFSIILINETRIYQDIEAWEEDNNITPDFVLPTSDFKLIVEAWRDYLLQ